MKPKIYFIPGLMCDERLWQDLFPLLEDTYECVHFPIPLKSSFDEIANTLNAFFKEEQITLVGFSLGAYISSYFTIKFPHRVKQLFVISATLCNLNEDEIQKRKNTMDLVLEHGFKGLSRKKVVSLVDESNINNETLIKLVQTMYEELGKEVFLTQLGSTLKRNDLSQAFKELNLPITFIYGNQDRLVSQEWMQNFRTHNLQICFNEFNTTSHMLPLEKAKEIAKIINP